MAPSGILSPGTDAERMVEEVATDLESPRTILPGYDIGPHGGEARRPGTHLWRGGAPKPPEIYHEVLEKIGVPIAHGYGMTECPMICRGSPSDTDEQLADTAGRLRTGDLAVRRVDGHVMLTGRLKDVIIRKGENISAKEIEDVLYGLPYVANAAVIAISDPERGERVCAIVETAAGQDPLTFEQMTIACAKSDLIQQRPRAAGLMQQQTPSSWQSTMGRCRATQR